MLGAAGMENPPVANMQDAAEIHTHCTNFLESYWLWRQEMWMYDMTPAFVLCSDWRNPEAPQCDLSSVWHILPALFL